MEKWEKKGDVVTQFQIQNVDKPTGRNLLLPSTYPAPFPGATNIGTLSSTFPKTLSACESTHTLIHAHTHSFTRTHYSHVHIHMHTVMHACAHSFTCAHTCTHTHTYVLPYFNFKQGCFFFPPTHISCNFSLSAHEVLYYPFKSIGLLWHTASLI